MKTLYSPQEVKIGAKIKQVDLGLQHCIALSKSGKEVFTWGKAGRGQLGITLIEPSFHSTPQLVVGINGVVTGVSAGFNHSACVTADGLVYIWGKGMSDVVLPNARKGNNDCLVLFLFLFLILIFVRYFMLYLA